MNFLTKQIEKNLSAIIIVGTIIICIAVYTYVQNNAHLFN